MTPAPDTGRTAEENEMREALDTIKATIRSYVERTIWKPEREYFTAVLGLFAPTERLLAQLQADLIAARKERDEWGQAAKVEAAERRRLNDQLRESALDHLARDISDEQEAANLIALAKMYGEACGALAEYRFAAVEWQGEQAEYKAAVEADAAHLRAENANLRDRVREAERAGRGPSDTGSHPTGGTPDGFPSLRDVDPSRIARLEPRVHVHIWASATELTGEQKAQPEWLWLAADDYLSFGRYQKKGTQAPYVRADIAVALALGIDARRVETLGSTCESPSALGGMPGPLSPEPQEAGDHEPR